MTTNPTERAKRRYLTRLIIAMALYIAVLFASIAVLQHGAAGAFRTVVALIPAVPVAGVFIAGLRYMMETDEFERTTLSQALAIAGGITALTAATYGFLENAGFPHLSAWWTWSLFMGTWAIASFFVRRAYQ